ncbi:MAG: Structural maintenance of chromosomes protein 1 [Icmadophila ericetorum]|nr:Structural maintenance of chromosomes protein 1 [Icmadophila ericetorum]
MGKLSRLELYNFKSYKGHHTLLFGDSYFTSIIGPNGSGKSNSMDAISFVLGIKSSHLRSSHLRDLVYRGRVLKTSKINGDGSATTNGVNGHVNGNGDMEEEEDVHGSPQSRNDPKTAWVMAVYEDDAGDEQMWKRSITTHGASEYRINNRQVTAQQYNEALEAENILIKARNFLVFQGDVEAIASQSPKDLTRLIEQISGSLEYKAEYERLKEAQEEALENQNFNLNRRRGINSEIKQYQEQKREADSYSKKQDQRDQAIVTHILWKLYHFQKLMQESSEEIQKHQEELKEHRRGIAKYEKNLEDAKKEQAVVNRDVSKVERLIKSTEKGIEEKENSLVPIDEKITLANQQLTKVQSRIAEIAKQRDAYSENVKRLRKDLKIVEKAEAQWEDEWRKISEREGRALSEADLHEYNQLKETVNKRIAGEQIKADNLARQQRADEETVNSLRSKVTTVENQIKKLEEEIRDIGEKRETVKGVVKQTQTEIESKKMEFNGLTSERLRLNQLRTELDEKLQEVLNKLIEAEDGKKQSDKEMRLKATIADMKRIFPGVKGRVSDLCKPKQKRYGDAVSTVLGRHFDAVVVDDEKTAKECIQFLREQRRGQATFIPLDTIQVKAINANLKGIHRGTRMAIDTIDFDKSVDRAMSYACGDAIVCDDLATARYICYEKGIEAKAVTLDGTVIHRGGLMTGGRGRDQNTRRWEDTEVDNLRKVAENLRSQLAGLPESRRNATEEETLQGELTGLEQKLSYAKEEAKARERNLADKKKELTRAKEELKDVRPKFEEKSQELDSLKEELKSHRDAIGDVEDEVFADFCERLQYEDIREYEAQQGSLQQEAAQKKLEYKQQKSKLENRINFEQKQFEAVEERINALEVRAQQDEALVTQLEAEKEAISNELDTLSANLDDAKEQLKLHQERYSKKADKVAEQRRELQKRSKNVDGVSKLIASLEADMQRNAADKYAILRRCKLEDITIPLADDSAGLDALPVDGTLQKDPDAMDVDEDQDMSSLQPMAIQDYGIELDFSELDDDLKESFDDATEENLFTKIQSLDAEMATMAPNMRAIERLEGVESRLKTTEKEFEDARRRAKRARDDFEEAKTQRFELFNKAFLHISDQIGPIYKELTRSASLPMGGQAYLDIEDSEEPYLSGLKYHAMPPLKRFRDMEHLSGGEKTMAALALLFAIHSFSPSPFFVLDEVDAALDNANVAKLREYVRGHARPGMQFIVISLKTGLFAGSEGLVGVYRDQGGNSSRVLTLDDAKNTGGSFLVSVTCLTGQCMRFY